MFILSYDIHYSLAVGRAGWPQVAGRLLLVCTGWLGPCAFTVLVRVRVGARRCVRAVAFPVQLGTSATHFRPLNWALHRQTQCPPHLRILSSAAGIGSGRAATTRRRGGRRARGAGRGVQDNTRRGGKRAFGAGAGGERSQEKGNGSGVGGRGVGGPAGERSGRKASRKSAMSRPWHGPFASPRLGRTAPAPLGLGPRGNPSTGLPSPRGLASTAMTLTQRSRGGGLPFGRSRTGLARPPRRATVLGAGHCAVSTTCPKTRTSGHCRWRGGAGGEDAPGRVRSARSGGRGKTLRCVSIRCRPHPCLPHAPAPAIPRWSRAPRPGGGRWFGRAAWEEPAGTPAGGRRGVGGSVGRRWAVEGACVRPGGAKARARARARREPRR